MLTRSFETLQRGAGAGCGREVMQLGLGFSTAVHGLIEAMLTHRAGVVALVAWRAWGLVGRGLVPPASRLGAARIGRLGQVMTSTTVDQLVEVGEVLLSERGVAVVRNELGEESEAAEVLKPGVRVVARPSGTDGTVVLYRSPLAIVAIDDDDDQGCDSVVVDGEEQDVATLRSAARELFGREVDWQCEPLRGESSQSTIFGDGLSQAEMRPIDEALATGVASIDLLTPLGRGQSVLLCGESSAQEACRAAANVAMETLIRDGVSVVYACLQPTMFAPVSDASCAVFRARKRASAFAQQCEAVLTANAALAAGSELMRAGVDTVVFVDSLEPLLALWRRSTALLADLYGFDNANLGDDSECRAFFSSLLQRSGRRKFGGSLSLVALVCVDPDVDVSRATYTLDDFRAVGTKASVLARLELLVSNKKLELTDELLAKIGVRPPYAAPGVSVATSASRKRRSEAVEMLTSIADAHVDILPPSSCSALEIEVDPAASLQRVGIGAKAGADTRPPAVKKLGLGNRLRLELAAAADTDQTLGPDARAKKRAEIWRRALRHVPGQTTPRKLSDLVSIALLVRGSYLDNIVQPEDVLDRIEAALERLASKPHVAAVLDAIDATSDLDDSQIAILNGILEELFGAETAR